MPTALRAWRNTTGSRGRFAPVPDRRMIACGLVVVFCGLMMSGCQLTAGHENSRTAWTTETLHRPDIATVAVPIFQNRTFYTGVERDITDAVIKEIEARTPYVVRGPQRADTLLSGTVVSVEKRKLGQLRGSGFVQDVQLTVTVDFEWKDLRTGEILAQRRQYTTGDVYIPARPVGERDEVGLWAVAEELAVDIVGAMRDSW